jgi:hypothetical protein
MIQHQFIFHPGNWIGEGRIAFSASTETIRFFTKWVIGEADPHGISCTQEVEMQGNEPNAKSLFQFTQITPTGFHVALESEILGKVNGMGIIDAKTIAWEFHTAGDGLEGFEVYELQDNGDYMLHAEYASPDQFRTLIDGRIWKKS